MDISKMRDFTEEEKEKYKLALKRIYKDMGVNIFKMIDKDKIKSTKCWLLFTKLNNKIPSN